MSNKFSNTKDLKIWRKTGGLCWYCGVQLLTRVGGELWGDDPRNELIIEHVHPRSKGGANDLDNLVPACRRCNDLKRSRSLEDFRERVSWHRIGVEPFTDAQIEWLLQNEIDPPKPPAVIFYFETQECLDWQERRNNAPEETL